MDVLVYDKPVTSRLKRVSEYFKKSANECFKNQLKCLELLITVETGESFDAFRLTFDPKQDNVDKKEIEAFLNSFTSRKSPVDCTDYCFGVYDGDLEMVVTLEIKRIK